MHKISKVMDDYYADAIIGFLPFGIGDLFTAVIALTQVHFSFYKIRSISLTLALLQNIMRDVFLGLLPFYIGNIIDFFHKSFHKNMQLIDGFLDQDPELIKAINRKAMISVVFIILFLVGICLLFYLIFKFLRPDGLR